MKPPRKLHIKSYGCQMNVYDAQRMVDTLAGEGFVETASVEDADLVILNTCHIREKASEKVYSELGQLRVVKDDAARQGREMRIAVAGCVAQAEGAEIIRRAPTVDVVVGPQSYHHLPQLLARAKSHGRALETEFPVEDKFGFLPAPKPAAIRARGISSFVTVQEGCDKFCTFCVVPYTRGAEVSRPVAKIIDDVMRLADNGVREITLIGYAGAYSFKYSPRPGTPAADMRETVSAAEMDERLGRIQELTDSQQSAFNKAMIGKTVDVLFERAARNPGQIVGRTAYLQPAHVFASPDIIGQVLPVKIESLERYSLLGELAGAAARPVSSTLSTMTNSSQETNPSQEIGA